MNFVEFWSDWSVRSSTQSPQKIVDEFQISERVSRNWKEMVLSSNRRREKAVVWKLNQESMANFSPETKAEALKRCRNDVLRLEGCWSVRVVCSQAPNAIDKQWRKELKNAAFGVGSPNQDQGGQPLEGICWDYTDKTHHSCDRRQSGRQPRLSNRKRGAGLEPCPSSFGMTASTIGNHLTTHGIMKPEKRSLNGTRTKVKTPPILEIFCMFGVDWIGVEEKEIEEYSTSFINHAVRREPILQANTGRRSLWIFAGNFKGVPNDHHGIRVWLQHGCPNQVHGQPRMRSVWSQRPRSGELQRALEEARGGWRIKDFSRPEWWQYYLITRKLRQVSKNFYVKVCSIFQRWMELIISKKYCFINNLPENQNIWTNDFI